MRRAALALALLAGPLLLPAGARGAPTEPHARLAGADRFATSAAVSAANASPGVDVVYVATGRAFPDALAAGAHGRPVLLVERDRIPPPVAAELDRLDPQGIVLLGGPGAVGSTVEQQLGRYTDGGVERVAGVDRYGTASLLSRRNHPGGAATAYVASGEAFPDALAAGAAAAGRGPVLLVTRDAVPAATAAELRRLEPDEVVVLGGSAAVSPGAEEQVRAAAGGATVHRRAGPDRFATSVEASRGAFGPPTGDVYLAAGASFADALAAGWAAGRAGSPVLLSRRTCVPPGVVAEVERLEATRVVLVGGTASLADDAGRLRACGPIDVSVIATGLQAPWDVAFAPGGVAYLTERDTGRVLRRAADGSIGEVHRFAVDPTGEGGLLGLEASPTFEADGLLYAYLTAVTDNRVVRFRPGDAGSVRVLVSGIPKASIHDGGRLAFGPGGVLYVSTGDAGDPGSAQDLNSLAGKILAVNPADGSPGGGNPFPGSRVWAYGFRNVQGMAWVNPDQMFATDLGPTRDDEVNRIVSGGDYGWPDATGTGSAGGSRPAVIVRQPPEASWSGAAVVHGGIPEWDGDLLVAALRGQRLYRFGLAADGTPTGAVEELLTGTYGRLRHVEQAPDGSIWVLTSNRDGRGTPVADDDRVIRIAPPG